MIGGTREGKSTLSALLQGIPLKAEVDPNDLDERHMIIPCDNNYQEISRNFGSQTIQPRNYDNYWDLPGVASDTRGATQDIKNSWVVRNLCMGLKKIKIVLVISRESLIYRKLIEVLKSMEEIFPEIEMNLSSLCMVITKNERTKVGKVREIFARMIEEQKDYLSEKAHKILEHFSKDKSPIVSFSRPKEGGIITDDEKPQIIKTIEDLPWYEEPRIGLGVSSESKYILLKMIDSEIEDFSKFIKENFKPMLEDHVKKTIDQHVNNAKSLKTVLKDLKIILDSMLMMPSLSLETALKTLEKISQKLNEVKLESFILKKQRYLRLLSQFEANLPSRDVIDCFSFLAPICKGLSSLREEPQMKAKNQIGTLKGKIISSQDINRALSKKSDISEMDVYSSTTVFIDDNITASGVTLCIVSPQVQVVGTPIINLSGKKGESHQVPKAENGRSSQEYIDSEDDPYISPIAACGDPGLPGLPGQNGGSLLIETRSFKNSESLSVNVNGGQGGTGQDGGDGAHGVDGREEKALKKIQNRDEEICESRLHVSQNFGDHVEKVAKALFTFNSKYTLEYRTFEEGQRGGDAGLGGKGGRGGKPGEIEVDGAHLRETFQEDGVCGLNGNPGRPGIGGKNSVVCVGVYVEEKILSSLRCEREIGADSAGDLVGSGVIVGGSTVAKDVIIKAVSNTAQIMLRGSSRVVLSPMTSTLFAGVIGGLTLKTIVSVISSALSEGWLVKPQKLENGEEPIRVDDGRIPTRFNVKNRKESAPVQRIDIEDKLDKFKKMLEKEDNLLIRELSKNYSSSVYI